MERVIPLVVLGWLAAFFGRTLFAGRMPLIERIARVSDPLLSPPLVRYTRRLTAIWAGYFVIAALAAFFSAVPMVYFGALVWLGSIFLFVGEHRLRAFLFPEHRFPSLAHQLRDTWMIWRRPR